MSYSVVKADLNQHKQDIFAVWERHYPGVILKKFEWMYLSNPAGVAHVWLLKHVESDQFVGVTAAFPKVFVVNNTQVNAAIAADFLIDQGHRSLGPALMLQRAVLACVDEGTLDLVYGFPNDKSEVILKKVGYTRLGGMVRAVKILRSKSFLMSRMPVLPATLLSYLLDTWLYLTFVVRNVRFIKLNKTYRAKYNQLLDCSLFINKNFKNIALPLKNSTYFNWRYKNHKINTISIHNKETKEIMDFNILSNNDKNVEVIDFFYNCEYYDSPMQIITEKYSRNKNLSKIIFNYLDNEKINLKMKKSGFFIRKTDHSFYVYLNTSFKILHPFLLNKQHWVVLRSDDDM